MEHTLQYKVAEKAICDAIVCLSNAVNELRKHNYKNAEVLQDAIDIIGNLPIRDND